MECKILIRSLKDSAADSKLKLLKEGETYGVEKPGGEKRIHIGATSQESEFDLFFFPNGGEIVTVTVSKIDLIRYMIEAKNEYMDPQQQYRLPISRLYEEKYQQTLGIQEESFQICFEKNVDGRRYYLSRPSGNELSKNYNYIVNICLPLITNFVFIRIGDNNGSWSFFLKPEFVSPEKIANNQLPSTNEIIPFQQIFYGAPGTGKSHTIKNTTEQAEREDRVFRTTFHPDSDYSTFVGCYKPTMKEVPKTTLIGTKVVEVENGMPEEKIVYRFVPQAFTNAYIKAWSTTEDVYLIIEEINRGNCAQIFGDLFQLLDRGDDGKSEYPIDADTDLGSYIAKELESSTRTDFPDGVKDGRKLVLPSNLYIWATMNTSDQSLFPIDSAFKRRWEWKYLPIEDARKNWKIKVNGSEYDWYKFLEAINKEVFDLTHTEDKQLGYFFAKAKEGVIDAETLVNKVYFYLWTDVFKDYDYESQKAFRKPNSNDPIAFKNFFEDLKNGEKVNEGMAEQVLVNLELEKLNKPVDLFG